MIPIVVLAAAVLVNATEEIFLHSVEKPVVYSDEQFFLVSEAVPAPEIYERYMIASSIGCRDSELPSVSGEIFPNPANPGEKVSVSVNASDPCGIRSVLLNISGPYSELLVGNIFIPQFPGNYSVFAIVTDDSDFRNTTVARIGVLTVRKKCHPDWKTFFGFGRELDENEISLFFNESMDPDCMCSGRALGLSAYNFYISVVSSGGVVFEKKCPSDPPEGVPKITREKYAVYSGKIVKIKLTVWPK